MKPGDAPPPGWYPDPEGRSNLRWWAGADWTDQRRPNRPPSARADHGGPESAERPSPVASRRSVRSPAEVFTNSDVDDAVTQIRDATRREIQRATRDIESSITRLRPIIVGQITRILHWVRIGIITAAVLVVVWFVVQFIAQATFLNWLGDRIDNIVT